jgi:ferredoxin-NADP reductase
MITRLSQNGNGAASVSEHDDVRWAHGYHPLRVRQVVDETPDAKSYVLEVTDELADLFRYRPGQFCTFRVHVGDEELVRSYSMSSAPGDGRDLTVTVKRVPGGRVSGWFHDHVRAGDVLEVTKPAGVFCTKADDGPVLAYCGGSGVTPVMSITRDVLASTERPVRILYANRDRLSVIFHDDLARLGAEHPDRLHVRHHLDDEAGLVDAAEILELVDGALDAHHLICGPGPFMDLVEATLLDAGVPPERISIERFLNEGQHAPANAAIATPGTTAATDDDSSDVPREVTVILKGKRTTIDYRPGDTLLDTARRGGLQPPYSCEAGNCATCMALLHDGTATLRANNALTPEELEEGWVLTCQALPHGDKVTVEYESF